MSGRTENTSSREWREGNIGRGYFQVTLHYSSRLLLLPVYTRTHVCVYIYKDAREEE